MSGPAGTQAAIGRDFPERPTALLQGGVPRSLSLDDLERDPFGLRRRVPFGDVAAITTESASLVLAAMVALEGWASRVDVVGAASAEYAGSEAVVLDELVPHDESGICLEATSGVLPTLWRLWSSGTTGVPSATDHTLAALVASARRSAGKAFRWGLLYSPVRMAGVQILARAYAGGDQVVDATHLREFDDRIAFLADHGVDAISATPTMWRRILQAPSSTRLRLRQVTLGGEIATQPLLDLLKVTFGARTTHVYASTEAGAVFAVSDGKEGFPVALLSVAGDTSGGRVLEIRDGILHVHAPASTAADPNGFVRTDDLVEVRGDRVHFTGRASGIVNVGGDKVAPERLEALLLTHPEVCEALVTSQKNSFIGNVLVAQVMLRPTVSETERLVSEIRAWVGRHLPRAYVPARIDVVRELATTTSGKVSRI